MIRYQPLETASFLIIKTRMVLNFIKLRKTGPKILVAKQVLRSHYDQWLSELPMYLRSSPILGVNRKTDTCKGKAATCSICCHQEDKRGEIARCINRPDDAVHGNNLRESSNSQLANYTPESACRVLVPSQVWQKGYHHSYAQQVDSLKLWSDNICLVIKFQEQNVWNKSTRNIYITIRFFFCFCCY